MIYQTIYMGCMKIDVNLQYDISTIPFYWLTTSSIDFPVYLLQQALFVSALGVGVGVGGRWDGGKHFSGRISPGNTKGPHHYWHGRGGEEMTSLESTSQNY